MKHLKAYITLTPRNSEIFLLMELSLTSLFICAQENSKSKMSKIILEDKFILENKFHHLN